MVQASAEAALQYAAPLHFLFCTLEQKHASQFDS